MPTVHSKSHGSSHQTKLDSFTTQYLATALWSSIDDYAGAEMLDASYSIADFSEDAIKQAIKDCQRFQNENAELLQQAYAAGIESSTAGHDFWLTRNHHGAGFWDGDYPKEIGDELTKAAHAFSELNPYAENGRVFFQ